MRLEWKRANETVLPLADGVPAEHIDTIYSQYGMRQREFRRVKTEMALIRRDG
jgi:hypothetical protein